MNIRRDTWGETIKDHHSKAEVQSKIYWTPEKININIPSKPRALLSRPSIPKQLKRSTRGLSLQRFVVSRNVGCWPPKVFSGKLEETDKKSFHFEGSSGISNTTIIRTHSIFFPFRNLNEIRRKRFL